MSVDVLQGDDINLTWLLDDVSDDSNSSLVVSGGGQDDVSDSLLEVLGDFSGLQVVLNGVIDLDGWVDESKSSSIMGDGIWNFVWSKELLDDLADLVLGRLVPVLAKYNSS